MKIQDFKKELAAVLSSNGYDVDDELDEDVIGAIDQDGVATFFNLCVMDDFKLLNNDSEKVIRLNVSSVFELPNMTDDEYIDLVQLIHGYTGICFVKNEDGNYIAAASNFITNKKQMLVSASISLNAIYTTAGIIGRYLMAKEEKAIIK